MVDTSSVKRGIHLGGVAYLQLVDGVIKIVCHIALEAALDRASLMSATKRLRRVAARPWQGTEFESHRRWTLPAPICNFIVWRFYLHGIPFW